MVEVKDEYSTNWQKICERRCLLMLRILWNAQGSPSFNRSSKPALQRKAAIAWGMAMKVAGSSRKTAWEIYGDKPKLDITVRWRCAGINAPPLLGMSSFRGDFRCKKGRLINDRGGSDVPACDEEYDRCGAQRLGSNLHRRIMTFEAVSIALELPGEDRS